MFAWRGGGGGRWDWFDRSISYVSNAVLTFSVEEMSLSPPSPPPPPLKNPKVENDEQIEVS